MEKQKTVRWNIANAIACVFEKLYKSKLKIKQSKEYTQAMERLEDLYSLNKVQIWILSLACDKYAECDEGFSFTELVRAMDVNAISIMSWKKEIESLIEKGFVKKDFARSRRRREFDFALTSEFCESITNNTVFIPKEDEALDEIEELVKCIRGIEHYIEEYNTDEAHFTSRELDKWERQYKDFEIVKRVSKEISNAKHRYILYILAYDVVEGEKSRLNSVVSAIYQYAKAIDVAKEMLQETHELFEKNLVEFTMKGDALNAHIALSDNGKKLLLAERAEVFERKMALDNMIKYEDISVKKLFYSDENQKEINKLINSLQEENLRKIQQRLKDEALPIGVTVLLHGSPGTGKTESVMQIAKATGRDIFHVDISQTKSCWFGESEKRVKEIFRSYKKYCEYKQKRNELMPILLFNEADAIISKRQDVTVGNLTQTENAIQNIILEELETIQGIFFATTNLVSNIDSAFERRFLFKIKFENPSVKAKSLIWQDKLTWLDSDAAKTLASNYDFSGGQIDNIVKKITFDEVISGERPSFDAIQTMCKNEKLETNAITIGFGCGK